MKKIIYVLLFIFAIGLFKHPNTKALIIGVSSVFIDAPIEKAKSDFRADAEKEAQKQAEIRMKKIDESIDASDHPEAKPKP